MKSKIVRGSQKVPSSVTTRPLQTTFISDTFDGAVKTQKQGDILKNSINHFPLRSWLAILFAAILVVGCNSNSRSGEQTMKNFERNGYLIDGHLVACPDKPNCVSSEGSSGNSFVEPLEISGSIVSQWQALQEMILEMGGQIEEVDNHFLHATFRSRVFRFIDDVTCRLDNETNTIQIRSASRVGYSDFGVNRKRVEELRKRLRPEGSATSLSE